MFHLLVSRSFELHVLYLDEYGYSLNWKFIYLEKRKCNCYMLDFIETVNFGGRKFTNPHHPYIVLGKKLNKLNNYQTNDFLSLFREEHIYQTLHNHDKYVQSNFPKYLKDNFHGDFVIYLTDNSSYNLIKYDKNANVFGIS